VTVQFLAFLKDSYREARSGWMLQIMLALSTLLILLVASIGFRPITVEDQLAGPLRLMTRIMAADPAGYERIGKPEFSIENVVATQPEAQWRSDYAFDFVVRTPTAADMRKIRAMRGLPSTSREVKQFLRSGLQDFESVDVEEPEVPSDASAFMAIGGGALVVEPPWATPEERFHVTARGNKVDDPLAWPHQVSVLFFYEVPFLHVSTRDGAYFIEKWLVNGAGAWILLFVAVIITAGFMPSMMAKGSLDLLISKPIGRTRLLVYKYVGGLTFVLILTSVTVVGVWLMIGLRTGLWGLNFLAIIPILTFYFAVLYAVSTLAAVLTRNTIVAILATGLAWGAFWIIGKVNDGIENREETVAKSAERPGRPPMADPDEPQGDADAALARMDADAPLWGFIPKWVFSPWTALHAVTPRTYQLDDRLGRVIAEGVLTEYQLKKQGYSKPPRTSWAEMVGVSLAFIAIMLAISCWRFSKGDY
jgi:ABC-type transport system involved in multi-copper enzyme maturation permease subunit